ncbi:MAG: 50S ribosomal protein L4 [Puniceicoccales bacterium]|jgi:large subunit ribosomal protein L4|nr:50S ribosomal protein L4 [Puniceicoccales bacterium]
MKLKIYNGDFSSCSIGDVDSLDSLSDGKGVVALKQYLLAIAANLRQGNACAKDRGDVSGTGKKPYRQKGTGMARHGSKRSPIWAGGGVVFGPKPRNYSQKINRRIKRLALLKALSDKASDGDLFFVDCLAVSGPKTKAFNAKLDEAFDGGSILFVDEKFDENFILASRNIGRVFMVDSSSLNAFDVVRCKNVVVSGDAMKAIAARLSVDAESENEKF